MLSLQGTMLGTLIWHRRGAEPVARLLPNPGRPPLIEKPAGDGWTEASIEWLRAELDPMWVATRVQLGSDWAKGDSTIETTLDTLGFGAAYRELMVGRGLDESLPPTRCTLEPIPCDAELLATLDQTLEQSAHHSLRGFDASALLEMTSAAGGGPGGFAAWYGLEERGQIVAACLLERSGGELGTLAYFAVVPSSRKSGFGRQMHRAALHELRRLGARNYVDATDIENTGMLRLFEIHGCRPFGTIINRRAHDGHQAGKDAMFTTKIFNPRTFNTLSRAFSTKGSDFTKIVNNQFLKQGVEEDQAKEFTKQGLDSFSGTPKLLPKNEQTLGIGNVDSEPTGTFSTTHDQLFGNKGLKSSEQLQEELALPGSNQAKQLFRFIPQIGVPQFSGTVAPQGPNTPGSDPSVFPKDFPGGGAQIFTPGGTFQPKNEDEQPSLLREKIQMGQQFDSAGRVPFEDTQ